jgi:hypothetical protein
VKRAALAPDEAPAHEPAPDDDLLAHQPPVHPLRRARRVARARLRCATCGGVIARGEPYREDVWRAPIFGVILASSICRDCQADGL